MKTSRREFIKQSSLASIVTLGMGPLLLTNVGRALEDVSETASSDAVVNKIQMPKTAEINQVPYISMYYINPKTGVGKDVVIDYYVRDYHHKDYMQDDNSAIFTVEYWVNGKKVVVPNITAGDHSITLKSLPLGKVLFALQATDARGRKSHRLYHEFLIVEPADAVVPIDKIYHPDLAKFGIYKDDSHPVETTKGLTEMLKWASDNGYKKVLLPKGRYRLDENSTVQMATKLTLDMNGSTFKLNPSEVNDIVMFEISNCFDSHVVNGTFEGDWKERNEQKLKQSEHVRGVSLGKDATYCSYENIKIVDVTGYGSVTGIRAGKSTAYVTALARVNNFTLGEINERGELIPSKVRTTNDKLVDLTKFQEAHGFIQMGFYLGYQGNTQEGGSYGSYVYQAHFYDADQKYLESIEGYMFRRLYLPKNAKYARFTLLRPHAPAPGRPFGVFDFRPPLNCAFINVHHENVRCVGMVPSGFNQLLVEGNTFESCGWTSAKCAFDAEDGWDLMQDLTFRNNIFGKNPHNEFVSVCGHNFIIENNVMGIYNNRRSKDFVVRNNKFKSAHFAFAERGRSGCPRIYQNTIASGVTLTIASAATDKEYCIKDNVIEGGASSRLRVPKSVTGRVHEGILDQAYLYKCKIRGHELGSIGAKFVQCDFQDIREVKHGTSFKIYESTIDNCLLKTTSHSSGDITVMNSKLTNSQIESVLKGIVLLQGNTIKNCRGSGDGVDHQWILRDNKIETSLEHLIAIKDNYKQVVLESNVITATNPKFSAISLNGVIRSPETMVGVVKSTFNGKGGVVLNMTNPLSGGNTLAVYLFENRYNGIEEINKAVLGASNVKILRTKPALG